ncbi:MAG: hypothetical protein JSW65_03575 [Candidatus Bipolaricaulota bacterium]|nr:MAG: hypothetical protein JSW65_03575 [Candidatus Bipolaricaulota bacterium]
MNRRTWLVVSVLLVVAVPLASRADTAIHVDARIDLEERLIGGRLTVEIANGAGEIAFLLLANLGREVNPHLGPRALDESYPYGFEPSETTIVSVRRADTEDGEPLPYELRALPPAWQTYSLADGLLHVDLPAGASVQRVAVEFETRIPRHADDAGVIDGILTWRFGWYPLPLPADLFAALTTPIEDGTEWSVPLRFPLQSLSATLEFPSDVEIVVGADHVEERSVEVLEDGEIAWTRVEVWNEGGKRTIALAVSAGYARYELTSGPVPIEIAYLPGHESAARLYATHAADILTEFEARFGPYPHRRLRLVEHSGTRGLSMAADGIVWLSRLFFTHRDVTLPGILDRMTEFVLAHEIAHQWFGLGAAPDLASENWLSEGLSQYLAVSYFERRHGAFDGNLIRPTGAGIVEDFIASQFGFLNLREHQIELPYLINVRRGFDEALVLPLHRVEYDNATAVRLYDKGYLVARALASAVGEEAFDRGLRIAAERYRGGRLTSNGLREALEEAAGRSLDVLFAAWVQGAESTDYAVRIVDRERVDDGYRTTVELHREGGAPQPVTVRATLRSGESEDWSWDAEPVTERMVLETERAIRRVSIDPDHRLPDRDRLNNHDPVRLVVAAQSNAFPLDGYLLRTDSASGGITLSYLDRTRLTVGEGYASAQVIRGRSHILTGAATLTDGDLSANVSYTHVRYRQPPTGSPSTYWEPALALTAHVRRQLFDGVGYTVLGASARSLPSFAHSGSLGVALELVPWHAGRAVVRAFDELRLFPRVYLQSTIVVGVGFGAATPPLAFGLEEMRSLGRYEGWFWVPADATSRQKLYARLALEVPSVGELPFNLINLAMVDAARVRPYVAFAAGWTSLAALGNTTPHVEAGVEALFDISAVGGLLPLRALVGYAAPILGGGSPAFFFRLSLP